MPAESRSPARRKGEPRLRHYVTQSLSYYLLPVDTASGGPIISPARKDAESEPAVTETETRDKLEALQERLTTLRDSL